MTILFALANGHLDDVEIAKVGSFESALLSYMASNHPDILQTIDEERDISDDTEQALTEALGEFKASVPY